MEIQEIKKEFFCYRNGMLGETLRRYGDPHKIIFGLDVPQIASIARTIGTSMPLAEELWADADVRESRLLASYLFDPAVVTEERAISLALDVRTQEEADMLAFRLLKRLPHAASLLTKLEEAFQDSDAARMTAKTLRAHID